LAGILGEYTELFLEESEDQIEELNANLLKLESDHSNPDIINDIFRAAHSLKSSAAFVGLLNLSDLAHKMENLLQKIREDKLSVNVTLVNLLFECFDLIKVVIDAVGQGEKNDTPFTEMITKLQNYEKQGGEAPAPSTPKQVAPSSPPPITQTPTPSSKKPVISEGLLPLDEMEILDLDEEMRIRNASAIDIKVVLKESTQMKGSRYALMLELLKPTGVIFKTNPEEDDLLKGGEILQLLIVYITQLDEEEVTRIIHSDLVEEIKMETRSITSSSITDFVPLSLDQDESSELEEEFKSRKGNLFDVRVVLKTDTPMKGLRFTLILQNLKQTSVIYKSNPDIEILERGTELNSLTFILLTESSLEDIQKIISVDMVDYINILPRSIITASKDLNAHETTTQTAKQFEPIKEESNSSAPKPQTPPRKEKPPVVAADKDDSKLTKSIKVSSEKLDQLMNNVGELVITNSGFQKIYDDLVRTFGDDTTLTELKSKIDQINRISKDLQSGIMNTRMVPIGSVFNRFSRLVRDLSMETHKKVQLILLGENTELDKKVVDMIGEPLLHLIRNSIDHGLETPEERVKAGKSEMGTVELNAYQGGNNIMVEIKDDGRGLNKARILKKAIENGLVSQADAQNLPDGDIYQFIFAAGFSTAAEVTDISGRGVGMNVVNKLVQDFKGKILINSVDGQGATFTLCFPQALAIIPSILVSMEEEIYAFPLSEVFETIRVKKDQINTLEGHEIFNLRGEVLPIYRLNKIIGLSDKKDLEEFPVVIVNFNSRKLGFIVDDMIGKHETVIKTLEKNFRNIPGLTGASIMGDGTIILVLDIPGLIELTNSIKFDETLEGTEMLRLNSSRSSEDKTTETIYKTITSTNLYNSKLLEMVLSDKSRRKKDKSTERKKSVVIVHEKEEEELEAQEEISIDSNLNPTESSDIVEVKEDEIPANINVEKPTEEIEVSTQEEAVPTEDEDDDGRLQAKEMLKSFSEQTKQRVEAMIDRPIDQLLSNQEIRKLETVVNTGTMNAGLVLSQLVGSNVDLFMPEIALTDKDSLVDLIRDPYEHFFGLKIRMNGDLNGNLLMIFSEEKGNELSNKLLKSNEHSTFAKKLSDDSLSVLSEISNIVCASIINSLSNKAKVQIMPSVPELVSGTFREVLDAVKPEKTKFLSMNTEFVYDGDNLIGNLIFLPDFDELVELIAKLK
jgi:two-component system, chemotaxis family, sensor kinase CheA